MRKRKRQITRMRDRYWKARRSLPAPEPPEQIAERIGRYLERTRERAMRPVSVPFPEHVTVLAGPLRRQSRQPYRKPSRDDPQRRPDDDADDA